jgi:glycosyltransferase involved in cell wall biosynthesis/2-polyprenyl-3-methyl-5-hydroxy-6-metoxy-1,4-benzoquinol methylase
MTLKVCFVTEHFYPHVGGAETITAEFVKNLVRKGHEVRVVTSNSGGVTGEKEFNGARVFYFECLSLFGHPILPSKKLREHIKWADIVHTTTYTAAPAASRIADVYKKPCIITAYEAIGGKWFTVEKNPLKAMAFLLFEWYVVTRRYEAWHAISDATKRDLVRYRVKEDRVFTIYPGIDKDIWNPSIEKKDLHRYLGFDSKDKIFLYSGRPGKSKGIFVFLEAIRLAAPNLGPGFKFGFILSDDPIKERNKIGELIRKYRLEDLVKLKGPVAHIDAAAYRRDAFAFVVPSLTEGFGFNAAETSALDVPIIVSDAGSLPEVAGGRLLFFRSGDASDLAEKILKAAKDEFDDIPAKDFGWEESVAGLIRLYEASVNEFARRMTPDYSRQYKGKLGKDLSKISTYRIIKSLVKEGGEVLDIGCGTGYLLDFVGGGTGADINPKLIKECGERYPGSKFIVSDCYSVPLPAGRYDTIIMCMIVEHLPEPGKAMSEAKRLLKDGGNLIIVVPRINDLFYRFLVKKDPTHVIEYTVEEITKLASEFFTVEGVRFGSVSTKVPYWMTSFIKPDIILNCIKQANQ